MPAQKPSFSAQRLRIIGGSLRGSKLAIADRPGLRPTPDRLRETLFNWLAPVIEGSRCLDLYAGTGALGMEALSRGASRVRFVERDALAAASLREALLRLKQTESSEVVCEDVIRHLRRPDSSWNLLFIDPPFDADLWRSTLDALHDSEWLAPGARIFVESPAEQTPVWPANWILIKQARVGASQGHLLQAPR